MATVQKTFKFRFYPNQAQRKQLDVEFGHARFVYNLMLEVRNKRYRRRSESSNYVSLSKLLTQLKKTAYPWLSQASSSCATQKLMDQEKAFQAFFAGRNKYPKFKSRHARQSIRYQLDQRIVASNFCGEKGKQFLKLPKLGKLKLRWSQGVPGTPKMVTVTRDQSGHYYVALMAEVEQSPLPVNNRAVGLDFGLKDLIVSSDNDRVKAGRAYRQAEAGLIRAQKRLSRRVKGSARRNKARLEVARRHQKVKNIRRDLLHKLSSRLVNENQVICLEDLNVKGMQQNPHLAKSISDAAFSELRCQLEYKSRWHGREVIAVDRWFASSKLCSDCGAKAEAMPLSVRSWICTHCGASHDRDLNAAKNILRQGLQQYREEHGNWPEGITAPANGQGDLRAA